MHLNVLLLNPSNASQKMANGGLLQGKRSPMKPNSHKTRCPIFLIAVSVWVHFGSKFLVATGIDRHNVVRQLATWNAQKIGPHYATKAVYTSSHFSHLQSWPEIFGAHLQVGNNSGSLYSTFMRQSYAT